MIKLHGFGQRLGLPDASPFVLKIDAYLRLAGLPFERADGIDNIRGAPKGKLPYISDDGNFIADSSFIVEYLENKYDITLDEHLSTEQRAVAYFIRSTLEEKLYWCTLYYRWVDAAGWAQIKPSFFGNMPFPLKVIVPHVVRRGTCAAVKKQGTGRHSPEEILTIARGGLEHINVMIGERTFLFGDKPCSIDATLYAFMAQLTIATIDTPVNTIAKEYPAIQRYCENFRTIYYES